jgi:CRISPR/Cas system CSM-associated protein Csm2 small subunit
MNLDEFKKKNQPASSASQQGGPPRKDLSPARQYPSPPDGLPAGYLASGYFDEKGNILPEVIIEWAKDIAQKLDQSRPIMNAAQLRKFFGEVRHIEGQLKSGKSFDSLRGRVLKLDAYASDALKKGNVPQLFKHFIEQNLKWAEKDPKNYLEGFVPHFESVVAYFPKKQ